MEEIKFNVERTISEVKAVQRELVVKKRIDDAVYNAKTEVYAQFQNVLELIEASKTSSQKEQKE